MHTAKQALDLWCPMVRVARVEVVPEFATNVGGKDLQAPEHLTVVAGCNSDALGKENRRMAEQHSPLASCRCISTKCAMWRWGEPWREARGEELMAEKRKGYCGLAGRPAGGKS